MVRSRGNNRQFANADIGLEQEISHPAGVYSVLHLNPVAERRPANDRKDLPVISGRDLSRVRTRLCPYIDPGLKRVDDGLRPIIRGIERRHRVGDGYDDRRLPNAVDR